MFGARRVYSPAMPATPPKNAKPPRDALRLDEGRLRAYLAGVIPDLPETIEVLQFRGGQSNPTYWIGAGERAFVLRKKPPGKLLPSAHAVEREYRVMKALAATDVPVPTMIALSEDDAIVGTPFYVMECLEGRIFRDAALPEVPAESRIRYYEELADTLAKLHAVDVDAVGLGDYGKRGGYVARQVGRWSKQYVASRTSEIPKMEALLAWLPEHVPASDETTLTHGDYRLDNLAFAPEAPRCLAVLDWELSTLGHPLADLAYACIPYHIRLPTFGGLAGVDLAEARIPDEEAFVARYLETSGRALDRSEWAYFKAFSLFRLAAIAQGVFKRAQQGNASSENAALFGVIVVQLAELAAGNVGL